MVFCLLVCFLYFLRDGVLDHWPRLLSYSRSSHDLAKTTHARHYIWNFDNFFVNLHFLHSLLLYIFHIWNGERNKADVLEIVSKMYKISPIFLNESYSWHVRCPHKWPLLMM